MSVDSMMRILVALFALSIGSTLASRDTQNIFRKNVFHLPRGGSSESTEISRSPSTELEDNRWRNELPEQLQKRRGALLKFLMPTGVHSPNGGGEQMCEVYVLGTAHVSKDSCEDVKLLMEHVRPDVLFLELCNQRINILEDLPEMNCDEEVSNKSVGEMTKEIMMHNPDMNKAAALSSVLLSKIQGDYATKLNVTIGGEFREAFNVAKIQHTEFMKLVQAIRLGQSAGTLSEEILMKARVSNGCSVVLGDRPVRLTLLRAWETCTLFGKIKLVLALAWSSLSQPSEDELREWIESIMNDPSNDILSKSIEDLSRHFPAIKKTIIEERDTYMGCKIIQTARIMGVGSNQDGMKRKIVAVVGAGHCPGINSILTNEVNMQGSLNVEEELQKVVETKKHRVDADPDMKTLITDVISIEPVI